MIIRYLKMALIGVGVSLALPVGAAHAQWTGCGMGLHGTVFNGNATWGGPVGMSTQGEKMGGSLNCDYRVQAFVLGGGIEYAYFFGDAKTLGLKTDTTLYGRLGVLINPSALLYAHMDWTQVDTGALAGKVNGWKIGIGDEFRVPNSPIYLDLRYSYVEYNVPSGLPPSTKLDANEFRVGMNLKFGPGMFGGGGAIFDDGSSHPVAPKCDGNVKKNC